MPPKGRTNRYKIGCLACTPKIEMAFDHRNKHNLRFHQDMIKKREHIRYQVVGAPRNPFEAASQNTVAQSACDMTNIVPVPDQAIEAAERDSNYHDHDYCLSTESLEPEAECQSDENLMSMAPIEKRPRLDCCDRDQDKILSGEKTRFAPVDLFLMDVKKLMKLMKCILRRLICIIGSKQQFPCNREYRTR